MNTVTTNESQLVKTIKAHLAKAEKYQSKAEEHFITAGQYLMTLKGNSPDQATFLKIVREQIGLGKSRTYELMQIADGTKTVQEMRDDGAERKARERANLSVTSRTETEDLKPRDANASESEPNGSPPTDHQSPWAAHGQPAPDGDDDVEFAPPEEIRKNILDSIERQKAITLAYKKILKAPSLNREMEDEVSAALGGLITILHPCNGPWRPGGNTRSSRPARSMSRPPPWRSTPSGAGGPRAQRTSQRRSRPMRPRWSRTPLCLRRSTERFIRHRRRPTTAPT
jgi:hypothetical protein